MIDKLYIVLLSLMRTTSRIKLIIAGTHHILNAYRFFVAKENLNKAMKSYRLYAKIILTLQSALHGKYLIGTLAG